MDALKNIMAIIDKNQDNISEGDYLQICNNLKKAHQEKEAARKGKWDDIMETYIEWKRLVRLAMEEEAMMKRVNDLYEHINTPISKMDAYVEGSELYDLCLRHHLKKNGMEQATEADTQYVRENLELVCQDIVNKCYIRAYRDIKYLADDEWRELTKHPEFEEFLDLLSPVELHMHRALCEPQGETLSRVYRQKEKIITHDGHYIKKTFKWFSHERDDMRVDEQEDEIDDFDNE